jgi:hypothetical protein
MIEIRAERNGMTLHNFAEFLGRIADAHTHELWMVDARPAYSDDAEVAFPAGGGRVDGRSLAYGSRARPSTTSCRYGWARTLRLAMPSPGPATAYAAVIKKRHPSPCAHGR